MIVDNGDLNPSEYGYVMLSIFRQLICYMAVDKHHQNWVKWAIPSMAMLNY